MMVTGEEVKRTPESIRKQMNTNQCSGQKSKWKRVLEYIKLTWGQGFSNILILRMYPDQLNQYFWEWDPSIGIFLKLSGNPHMG